MKAVYLICKEGRIAKDFGLRDQMQRSAISIMSNIAEGYEKGSASEFHRYLFTAKGSCAELKSQLYIAVDIGYIENDTFALLLAKAEELSRIIGGLRSAVAKRKEGK